MNYSVYAIPAYYVLSLAPHSYGLSIIRNANNGYWDNHNPRGIDAATMYKKSVPAAVFAKFEKAEGAHKNGMENLPLFIGAVILGNMAKLESSTLNTVVGSYLALRVVYTALYIKTTKNSYSYARTTVWGLSTSLLFYLIVKAANKMAS